MKRTLLFIACVLASFTMLAQDELAVGDVQNSGCLSETRGEKTQSVPTIVLQKDGSILTVELFNYVSNCSTSYFDVESNVKDGIGGASSTVTLDVNPVNTSHFITTCECPINVSFTVHDVVANSFYLNCWWYHGLVELTEGEQFVLEYLSNDVEVDGIFYNLVSGGNVAVVTRNQNGYTGDVSIPESVYYEGVKYSVTSINESAFNDCIGLASVTIPNSVASISQYAFCGCNNLSDVYCYAETVPTTGNDAFIASNIGNATLHVPAASVSAYQAVEPWKNFKEIVALEEQMAYHPFLKEGKTWNYREYYHNTWNDNYWTKEVSYVINGTTEIDGKTYYKLYRISEEGNNYYCALREEDRKVWQYTSSEGERLLYDFGISVGDSFTPTNYPYSFQLTSIKPKWFHHDQLLNVLFYDIMLKQDDFTELVSLVPVPIVEGVGCLDGWNIMELFRDYPTNGIVRGELFLSCYEDGKCIFTADDFNNLTADDDIAYRPFVEEGKVWKVGALNSGNPVQVVKYYYFEGDTIINGKACKQMMCQQYVDPDFAESNSISQDNSLSYVGAWYEENQKVYFCDATNNQFKLMYDFSLDANATFEVDNLSYVIGPRQTGGIEGFKGVHRDVRRCESGENSYSPTWMEGVGSIDDPTKNVYYVDEAPSWCLMSCTVGDEVIYLNDEYEDGATPMVMESRRHRIDFTHTIKTRPRVPASPLPSLQGTKKTEKEESQLYGDYSNVQLGINLDPLNDAYLVCITNVTGKAVYEKTINAASIVGLDIDISAYAEGRYTVTVENSYEAFTGEIVLGDRTTGISIIPALFQEERAIYNLQGQRLRALQKGLNIVNGKMVIVK